MNQSEKEELLKQAEQVFFDAMLDGYAGERKHSTKVVSHDGNKKTMRFTKGDFTGIY